MDLKVLLVVLSLAAVSLAAGPNADVKSQGYNVHGQKLQGFGSLSKPSSQQQQQDAATILQRWCKSSQMSQDATTQSFKELIESLKQTSAQQLEQLTQQVVISERICQGTINAASASKTHADAGSEDLVKDVYMDALIGAETRATMKQLVRCIDSGKVDKIRANFYLTRLSLVDEDTVTGKDGSIVMELVDSLMKRTGSQQSSSSSSSMSRELLEAIERQKMFATTASLAKSLKKQQDNKQSRNTQIERMAEQVTKTIAERYIYTTASAQQQQQESADKKADRQAALKAIGNIPSAYYPKEIVQLLLKLASTSYESNAVRQSAIEALEDCDEARQLVKSIIKDVQEPTEVRIAAYRCLMTMSVTVGDIDELIALVSDSHRQSQDKQLVMYIVSHLNNVRNTNNRDYEQIVDILHANKQHYMAVQLLAKKFSHMQDMRKYSRNFQLEQSIGKIESGLIVESDLIYGDEEQQQQQKKRDYLPKLVRLNVSMPVFGKNVNVMEIAVRQDNMEDQIMRSMPKNFALKNGKLGMDSIERIVDAIKSVAKEQQQQQQQEQEKINNKNFNSNSNEEPEADLSIKVDGCTVLYVSLDDFKSTTSNQQRIRRNARTSAFEDVLDVMKKSFAFNRGAHFAINKRLAGILDIDAVLTGAMRVESRVHSISADQFEIVAHVQPRFGFEAIVGPSTISKRLLQRISTESSLAVHMKYSRSELVEVQVDLPMDDMELFKFQSEIVEQTRSGSYKYTRPSSMTGRDTDVYSDSANKFNTYNTNTNNYNKWSLKGKKQSTDSSSGYYAKQLEMPAKLVRALGLDGKIELVYSPRDLTYLARCVVSKVEPSMQGYRFQIQSQKSNNKQQQQYAIVVSTPGSSQVDRNIQMRVLKQTTPQRVTIKTDLISSFAAGSAQLELVRDERQVALRLETISRQGKAAKLEAGFQQTTPVMNGKKQVTLKPYMTIVVPNQPAMRFDGLVSIQQGPKTVIAYDFKMPEQLFTQLYAGKRSTSSASGQAQFVRGKIIADIDEPTSTGSYGKQRRSMPSPLERAFSQDVVISSETVAQLGELAVKLHAMLESKAQESLGVEVSTQYQLGAHKRQEQSKFAAKLHYQVPRNQQKGAAQRQSLYLEHECTAHPEHAFLVQVNHAYKPEEQQDLSIDLHYAGNNKSKRQQGTKEQVSYSHQLKYKQDAVECVFAIKATPVDYEREAKLIVQADKLRFNSSSAKFQSLRNSRSRSMSSSDDISSSSSSPSLKAQLVVVDTLKKETTVEARYEMNDYKSVMASLKLGSNNNKRQYRVAHQVRRDESGNKFNNKLQLDIEGRQSEIDYVVRAEKLSRGVHELIVDGVAKTYGSSAPINFETKTRVQYERDIGFEHRTQTSEDFHLELVVKPQQGIYKLAHQSEEIVMEMMARVMPNPEPVKQIQWQLKQRRTQFVHQTKVLIDEREDKLVVQSQQQSPRNSNKSYKLDALLNFSSKKSTPSYLQAVWDDARAKASIEYQPESGHLQSQINTRSISHKTIVDVRRKHSSSSSSFSSMLKSLEDCEIIVQSRTDKNSKLVCEIQAQLSSARQARQQLSMNIPKWYEIKVEMINGDGRSGYGGMLAKQVRYVAKKGQENKSKNTGYEQYQLMMDASAWPNTKFESDVTDYTGRRSSFAADMWAQEEKPSTFAMQSPMYVSQSELVFGREQGLRLKGSLKNLERNERYELDTGLSTGNKHRSHFKLDAPEHKSFAFFEPQTQSGEFSIERPAHKSSPWSLKSKFESERDQQQQGSIKSKLGRFVRRATVEYDDETEQHQHSFQFTPSTENVKFMSERRFKSPQQQQQKPWWKLQTDVSSYRAQESRNKPSMFNLETADYDADFTVKPFGEEQHAAWKIRARRSINEGELSKYHSSKDSSSSSNKKDNKKESGKTYKAMMKHLSDKQLRALLESECSSSGERCKSKLHVPSKFTSRYEHDFDYENKSTHSTNDYNNNKKSSRLSKFDFELDAPERKFSHMSSFEMERPRGSPLSWRHKRSTGSTYERSGSSSLISLRKNLENMDARIKSKTVYDNDELYNIDAQLNQGLYSNNKQDNKPLSSLKFNTQQWRSEMQYQPESHAQFEFVTPEQRRHLTRFEPMTESADMLKFTSKSFNKRGNQEYQMQGQFPRQYLRQLTTDSNNYSANKNVMIDDAQQQYSAPTKFDYQDDSYKAGFDFDNERTNWYMNNAKTGFEHNTKLARSFDGKQQQQEKVLTTITKSARFGTLAYVDVSVSPVDKSMTINIESALIKGKIVAESVRGTEQKVIKFKFENQQNINEQIARELVREYLSTNNKNYNKFVSSKYVQKIETLVKQLAQVPFKHETELMYDAREQSYKIKTQIERNQQLVLDASATVMPDRQTVARCHTRRIQSELIVDHQTGAFQVRATGETIRDNKPFTHETVVEKLSNDLYSVQSRTTYKQRELATIVGRVMTPSKALYTQDKVSQIEATLFEAKYRVMARQSGDLVKVIVQDDKRQLVHDNEFKYDQQRERVEFQCRTTDNKYNTVVYKSQGVVALDSDEVSHIVIDSANNKAQLKAQYVPKKELNVAVEGATMKHMTKLELPQSNGARTAWAKAVKQMKLRSYTKSQKLSYDVDAFVDTYQPIYKIKAQAFDAKDRQMFDLIVVGQPQQRSIGKLNTRHFTGELVADHKTDSVELRCETDNKKYTHETQVQRIGGQDYTIRSITNYKNQQLVKLVGRVAPKELISTRSYRSTTQGGSTTGELEAHLFDQQYKVIAQANKIQGGKMHKYTLNVDDNKRNIVSQNDIVYDTQREQIVFQSRVADKYQGGIIYKADGRISTQADDEQSSQIKYVSQRSQMNVEYKPKKEMLIDIETPEVEHSTKLTMPTTQVASRTPWKSAFQQMNLSSSLNAPLRSSPYKKFAYNFDADFDVHRKPSMFAIKLH